MTKKHQQEISMHDFDAFDKLLSELEKPDRSRIRLIKVDDQGLVEPARRGSSLVMQPRVRVVATALDSKAGEILRYQKKWDVGSGKVTINVFSGRGSYTDSTGTKTRDQITAALEARGFMVSQGEWTPESAREALIDSAVS